MRGITYAGRKDPWATPARTHHHEVDLRFLVVARVGAARQSTPTVERPILGIEQLERRLVPATLDIWTDATGDKLWSTAGNWSAGVPDSADVAVLQAFDGTNGTNDDCIIDNSAAGGSGGVVAVAGIQSQNSYSGALRLNATNGTSVEVSASNGDTGTGFKWSSGGISFGSAQCTLTIWGGGSADYNTWRGGTIGGDNAVQGNVYMVGATLRITGSASRLGANIIVGQDGSGGSMLEFHNQTAQLTVTNNAYIKVADTSQSQDTANEIDFNTDLVNTSGTASYAITRNATSSGDSYIDNYGIIDRSNPGTYQMDLPIKNESGLNLSAGTLVLESSLWISGASQNKTANNSVDQEDGLTRFFGSTLTCRGFMMNGGLLQTYGANVASISADDGYSGTLLTVTAGTMKFAADNPTLYGRLDVMGDMNWSGGTYQAYINGASQEAESSYLAVSGQLTLTTDASVTLNVVGQTGTGQWWAPLSYGTRTGNLTVYNSGNLTVDWVFVYLWISD